MAKSCPKGCSKNKRGSGGTSFRAVAKAARRAELKACAGVKRNGRLKRGWKWVKGHACPVPSAKRFQSR